MARFSFLLIALSSHFILSLSLNLTVTVSNLNTLTYRRGEPVRLQADLEGLNASQISVTSNSTPVWSQIEVMSGSTDSLGVAYLWVALPVDLAPGGVADFAVTQVDSPPIPPTPVWASAYCNTSICSLGLSGALTFVPSSNAWEGPGLPPPSPLLGVEYTLGEQDTVHRLGNSVWSKIPEGWTQTGFTSTLTAVGPVFAEALLEYTFVDVGGAVGVASWRVRSYSPTSRPGPLITERHNMSIDAGVELLMGSQWAPTTHVGQPWFYCNRSLSIDPNG